MTLVQIEASKLIIVTEDHGGYKAGRCVACGACGWLSRLEHKSDCPVPAALEADKKPPEPRTMFTEFDPECIPGN